VNLRLLTFRFDDGFMDGARKAAQILDPYRGSYFIVGDRTLGLAQLDGNPQLCNRNFGAVEEWRAMARHGHDIQPHSYSHRRFSTLSSDEMEAEIRKSVHILRSITDGPLVFAFPFNDVVSGPDWLELGLEAAGFQTRSSADPILFNDLSAFDRFNINSWAVRERDWSTIVEALNAVPEGTWTVLAFHSLDDEGFEPWSSESFRKLVSLIGTLGFDIVTAREALARAVQTR
jgi:peptidoglycan/xylan/chitin deacetylase (PgdA/CDA1 family)